jgi:putative hydrolase of the HAD superfamily
MAAARPVEAVLFDLGGTLLHYQDGDEPNFRRMTLRGLTRIREGLEEFGYPAPPNPEFGETVDRHVGAAYLASLAELRGGTIETPIQRGLEELGISPNEEQWADLRARFYSAVDEIVTPRAGVRETLAALHDDGYKLALISNTYWAGDLHDRHLRELSLLDYLPQRTYSSTTPHMKPHPSIFNDALKALGVEPQKAVYVGDRLDVDVGGAQEVGMRGVLIISPYVVQESDEKTRGINPDATLAELPDLLDSLASWG